jgi:hypothetical protein
MGWQGQSREECNKSGAGAVEDKRLDARQARSICWCNPRAPASQSKVYLQIEAESGKAQRVDVNAQIACLWLRSIPLAEMKHGLACIL